MQRKLRFEAIEDRILLAADCVPVSAAGDFADVAVGETTVIDVLGNDSGKNLKITSVSGAELGDVEISKNGKSIVWTSTAEFIWLDSFSYTIESKGKCAGTSVAEVFVFGEVGP